MKKDFLKAWRGKGSLYAGAQNQWNPATCSSLSDEEKNALKEGKVIQKPKKFTCLTKLFVMDETGSYWSIIIANVDLDEMVKILQEKGFQLKAA